MNIKSIKSIVINSASDKSIVTNDDKNKSSTIYKTIKLEWNIAGDVVSRELSEKIIDIYPTWSLVIMLSDFPSESVIKADSVITLDDFDLIMSIDPDSINYWNLDIHNLIMLSKNGIILSRILCRLEEHTLSSKELSFLCELTELELNSKITCMSCTHINQYRLAYQYLKDNKSIISYQIFTYDGNVVILLDLVPISFNNKDICNNNVKDRYDVINKSNIYSPHITKVDINISYLDPEHTGNVDTIFASCRKGVLSCLNGNEIRKYYPFKLVKHPELRNVINEDKDLKPFKGPVGSRESGFMRSSKKYAIRFNYDKIISNKALDSVIQKKATAIMTEIFPPYKEDIALNLTYKAFSLPTDVNIKVYFGYIKI